ncbi:Topoisomerase II-associated protein PAT1 [Novymonas esmeraldas]|uniref:Topoisomerase II-associated protein PAT1 n=1 Tax=Novymonas esmeraldas TaxID=1808958 RepID=A0AAW0EPY7_9TRYP
MAASSALSHTPDRFILMPFRLGEKDIPDWTLCSRYVATNHSSNNTTTVDDAIKSMAAYHNTIVKTCTLSDTKRMPNESFIQHTLLRYCRLVGQAQAHLPLHSGHVSKNLKFVWRDSFDESAKYESTNSNSELVSCVYNLAASYAYVAATQAHTGSAEEVKEAYKNFQNAAGYYEMVSSMLDRLPPDQLTKGDMKRDSLTMLTRLCLAQAHHCGYLKAEEAMKGKQDMLSKIAAEAARLYEEVLSSFKTSVWLTKKAANAKDVEAHLGANVCLFKARAHLHLGVKSEGEGEMGEAIAHYRRAKEHLAKLPRMTTQPLTLWVNSVVTGSNTAEAKAEKANSSVYFARIPKEVVEPVGLPRALGTATEHPSFVRFVSTRGEDPFFGIVPAHIAKTASAWREKQRNLVNACTSSAAHTRKSTQAKLQTLGVVAVIQTLSGEFEGRGRVPEPLRSTILSLREENKTASGATSSVTDVLMSNVNVCNELYQVADSKLTEIKAELEKDKKTDERYVEAYGEKMWRAVHPAADQTPDYRTISASISEHEKGLQQWVVTPFNEAKKTIEDNIRNIARLDWPVADLDALMPFVETKEARHQSSKVMELVGKLKELMEAKERIEKEQAAEEKVLQDKLESDDVVFSISSVESTQRDAVLAKGAQDISDAIEKVNERVRQERAIVPQAEELMEQIGTLQSADPIAAEIQKVSNGLENACSLYQELKKDFAAIVQYGTKATDEMDTALSNAKSYTMSRELQAQEVQNRLDSQIAAKMSQMQDAESQIAESRRRQENLQQQIASLQQEVPQGRYAQQLQQQDQPPQHQLQQQQQHQPPPPQQQYQQQQQPAYQYPPSPLHQQAPASPPHQPQHYQQAPPSPHQYPPQQQQHQQQQHYQQAPPPPHQYPPQQQQHQHQQHYQQMPPSPYQYPPPPPQDPQAPPSYDQLSSMAPMATVRPPSQMGGYQYPPPQHTVSSGYPAYKPPGAL